MNLNGKNALVIGGSAALAGAVIYGGTKALGWIKSKRAPKAPESEPEKTNAKPVNVETETE